MMKVDDKAFNNTGKVGQRVRVRTAPSFTANPVFSSAELGEDVARLMPRRLGILKKLGTNGGEVRNIIINALGTGLVAPIFIKYNFMSKTDEDTRTYSAWRQPVSAVLAVVTQCGLTAPFNRIFDNWANKGVFGEKLNKTLFMDDYYIAKKVKEDYPNVTRDIQRQKIDERKKAQKDAVINTLREENTVKYNYRGKIKKISDTEYRNLLMETIDNLYKRDVEREKTLNTTIEKREIISNYYRKHNKEAKSILEKTLQVIQSADNVDQIDSFIAKKINNLRNQPDSKEMIKILGDIQERAHKNGNGGDKVDSFKKIKAVLKEDVNKKLSHVAFYADIHTDAEVKRRVKASVEADTLEIKASKEFFRSLKQSLTSKKSIKEIQQEIDAKRKTLRVKNSSLNCDFVNEVYKQLVSRTKSHMACFKQVVGVFVSLAVLPFTCTLLNWVYPRFMDIFFPNLSSKKHDNESAKLINKAPKKAEVA